MSQLPIDIVAGHDVSPGSSRWCYVVIALLFTNRANVRLPGVPDESGEQRKPGSEKT
jgi:hypothetical protein